MGIPSHYIKPKYLRNLGRFARHDRPLRPNWGCHVTDANIQSNLTSSSSRSRYSSGSSQYFSASAMQSHHVCHRDMGHVPQRSDGMSTLADLIQFRNDKRNYPRQLSSEQVTVYMNPVSIGKEGFSWFQDFSEMWLTTKIWFFKLMTTKRLFCEHQYT